MRNTTTTCAIALTIAGLAAGTASAQEYNPGQWDGPRATIKAYVAKRGGETNMPGRVAYYGDFNGDGQEDAVVFVWTSIPGAASGMDLEVVLFKGAGGSFKLLKKAPNVQGETDKVNFSNGSVEILSRTVDGDDMPCCPTHKARYVVKTK